MAVQPAAQWDLGSSNTCREQQHLCFCCFALASHLAGGLLARRQLALGGSDGGDLCFWPASITALHSCDHLSLPVQPAGIAKLQARLGLHAASAVGEHLHWRRCPYQHKCWFLACRARFTVVLRPATRQSTALTVQVEAFLLAPASAGLREQNRRKRMLRKRNEMLRMGADEEDLQAELQIQCIR